MTQPRTFLRYKNGEEREKPFYYSKYLKKFHISNFVFSGDKLVDYVQTVFTGPIEIKINGKVEFIVWEEIG